MTKSTSTTFLSPSSSDENLAPDNFYLWGYQPHFAVSLRIGAKQLFDRLDERLAPDAFLVAIHSQPNGKAPVVVVEPPHHSVQPSDLANVLSLARESEASIPGTDYAYAEGSKRGELWAETSRKRDFRHRVGTALYQTVAATYTHVGRRVVVSAGRDCGPYFLYTVLSFDQTIRDEYPHLQQGKRESYAITKCLVDAVADQFSRQCWEALPLSFDGAGHVEFPAYEATLRSAAESFMHTPFAACDKFDSFHDGFQIGNEVSSLTYEKAVGRSRLLLCRRGHQNISVSLGFTDPIPLRNYRAVRKILELAGADECLLCDSESVYGLGTVCGTYDPTDEDLFIIEFVGHAKWELKHAGISLMRVEHGVPSLPRTKKRSQQIAETFERLFPESHVYKTSLMRLATAASELSHGAIVIFAEDAEEEAARFGNQATCITPKTLTAELLQQASRIDGAVLAAPDGMCHAIGVILDGAVNPKGTADRGARYNSTVRYVLGHEHPCMGIVVSDDGSIDTVPAYVSRQSRHEIAMQIETLQCIASESPVAQRKLNEQLDWFCSKRFYLSPQQCELLNTIFPDAQTKADGSSAKRVFHAFEPDPEMGDSYLKP